MKVTHPLTMGQIKNMTKQRQKLHLSIFFILIEFFVNWNSHAQSQEANKLVHIATFNILAPCWVIPSRYPASSAPFLDRALRRSHIIAYLKNVASSTDIIALQETTPIEFEYFKQALQKDFLSFNVSHDPNYWSNWKSPEVPWEPNGVAIFVKKTSFSHIVFHDLALSSDGNHSAYFEGVERKTGIAVRAASVHLDSDHNELIEAELKALLAVMPPSNLTRDFIIGDFNTNTEAMAVKPHLVQAGFSDVLSSLGHEEWTSPYSDGDYTSREWGIIDHIVTRNAVPQEGHVNSFGLWKKYPMNEKTKNQDLRITANLQTSGSDHFPVSCTVKL